MSTMWSTCSMSTGHCSTQAPQVTHDHRTSGSMTPPASAGPTRGRSASASTLAGSFARSSSEAASRYGALASAWSRRFMISSLGLSGLSVFQAGHCDWQRPHSVHVAKSSMPFQVKSSMTPRPILSSSPGSSKSTAVPPEYTGSSGPRPRGRRENMTLNGARKMCRCLEYTTSTRKASTTPSEPRTPTVSSTSLAVRPSRPSQSATASDANAPCAVREVAGVDLRAAVEQQRPHHVEDHEQDEPGGPEVRAEEPGPAALRARGSAAAGSRRTRPVRTAPRR